ncbi:hypothetical protein [Candidatus Enterococcus huntleyi]|uniref:hypothetical protein n=1 Tax=Candidatus Enterococcus huntleyi TaxID=1857217 RepID=UPI001379998F|nr:hypothetical protein [Enterococcus sp. JM4C]
MENPPQTRTTTTKEFEDARRRLLSELEEGEKSIERNGGITLEQLKERVRDLL